MTHKLLQRQLKRSLGVADEAELALLLAELQTLAQRSELSPLAQRSLCGLEFFLVQVDEAYVQGERALGLSTRSLELSSDELSQANEDLREQAATRELALKTLRVTTNQLLEPLGQHIGEDDQSLGRLTQLLSGLVRDFLETRKSAESSYAKLQHQQFALDQHAIVSITDKAGRILYANEKFCSISKISYDDLIGKDHRVVNSGLHSKEFFREMWSTISSGKVWHGEIRNQASDGTIYWVAATIVPFLDSQQQPYQYISLRTDITAQKAMEAEIVSRGRMLENIMDTLGEGVYLLDSQGVCTYANREAESLLGWSREEMQGQVLHDLIHANPADGRALPRSECAMQVRTQQSEVYRSETEVFTRKSGGQFPIAIVAAPIIESGQVTGSVAAFQDISARKRTEEDLRQADVKQRMLIDNAADAVLILGSRGELMYANELAIKLLGYSHAELLGVSIFSLLPGSFRELYDQTLSHELGKTRRLHTEVPFTHKDGHEIPLELNAAVLPDGNVYVSCRDITLRKEVENQLLRAKEAAEATSKAKSDFLATMSHEIRTPMNGIIGMTDLALETQLDADQRDYLGLVKSSADSLLTIINDILDFSKIESGKMELEQVEFDLRSLLTATTKVLAVHAEQKGMTALYEVEEGVPESLLGDPGRLRQVLTNLLGNAFKFADRGEVSVRVKTLALQGSRVVLGFEVQDEGIGIASDKLASIFEVFTQADTSTTRKYGGTGLGLAISSRLVAAMGGRLSVKSALGTGSVFSFDAVFAVAEAGQRGASTEALHGRDLGVPSRLHEPLDQRELSAVVGVAPGAQSEVALSTQEKLPDGPSQQALHILLAEDNAVNQKLALTLLAKWGHRVAVVSDGLQAVEQARQQHYDVILMDLQMREMGGLEATRLIRAREAASGRHTPIVALTANAMSEDEQRCLDAGMDGYLSKPLSAKRLRELLATIPASAPPASLPHSVPEAPFDYAGALASADPWVVETIGQAFLDDCPRQLTEIKSAIEASDAPALMRAVHTFRGLVGNFNAQRVEKLARELEHLGRAGDLIHAHILFSQMEDEMQALSLALARTLAALP